MKRTKTRTIENFSAPADTTIVSFQPYVSIRQHTPAYVSKRQHTSANASIRQHTSAYVSIRRTRQRPAAMEDTRYIATYLRVLAYLQRARVDGGEARRYRLLAYIRQP